MFIYIYACAYVLAPFQLCVLRYEATFEITSYRTIPADVEKICLDDLVNIRTESSGQVCCFVVAAFLSDKIAKTPSRTMCSERLRRPKQDMN